MSDTQSYKSVTFSEIEISNLVVALSSRREYLVRQIAEHEKIEWMQTIGRLRASKDAVDSALAKLAEVM